jgi:uncharacterized membrane protein
MHFSTYIIFFTLFSFIGFVTDSFYCSLEKGKFVRSGYVPYIPLCPLYGEGGLLLFLLQKNFGYLPWYYLVFLGFVLITLAEYAGGVYSVRVLKERLWDYTGFPWNVNGHISLFHCTYWFLIVYVFIKYLYPFFSYLEIRLTQTIRLSDFGEVLSLGAALFIFVLVSNIEFLRRRSGKKSSVREKK